MNKDDGSFLINLLSGELQRHRAIVHIDNLRKDAGEDLSKSVKAPLVERLSEYPVGGVDLTNIVEFPPKLAVIPVKPIFLDVAWNYIDYPGREQPAPQQQQQQPASTAAAPETQETQQTTGRRGWFGFGR